MIYSMLGFDEVLASYWRPYPILLIGSFVKVVGLFEPNLPVAAWLLTYNEFPSFKLIKFDTEDTPLSRPLSLDSVALLPLKLPNLFYRWVLL